MSVWFSLPLPIISGRDLFSQLFHESDIFIKDSYNFIFIISLYFIQIYFGISSFSHPDNALEVCGLLTPLHIVPEWYFL